MLLIAASAVATIKSFSMPASLIILADGPPIGTPCGTLAASLGRAAPALYEGFLRDIVAVIRELPRVQPLVRYSPRVSAVALAELGAGVDVAPAQGSGSAAVRAALSEGLADGLAVLVGDDLPHLPPWRLRDALTYLEDGADVVIGPAKHGGWYLLGLRSASPELLAALPGRGELLAEFVAVARQLDLRIVMLPAWFGISGLADLATLIDALSSMPVGVAQHTRALLNGDGSAARAVGE